MITERATDITNFHFVFCQKLLSTISLLVTPSPAASPLPFLPLLLHHGDQCKPYRKTHKDKRHPCDQRGHCGCKGQGRRIGLRCRVFYIEIDMKVFPCKRPYRTHEGHGPDRCKSKKDQYILGNKVYPAPDNLPSLEGPAVEEVINQGHQYR